MARIGPLARRAALRYAGSADAPTGGARGMDQRPMKLLDRLRGSTPAGNVPPAETCAHENLVPRWRGPEVMDDDSKAMGFVCHRCHSEFLPYEVVNRRLRRR